MRDCEKMLLIMQYAKELGLEITINPMQGATVRNKCTSTCRADSMSGMAANLVCPSCASNPDIATLIQSFPRTLTPTIIIYMDNV